ncbi:hypothetical protein, partial [Streptomyces sp. URMC 123]|uniref:hypothetical protein n=1 Tax=Streptomyces sp. URMC 123 TaxID=3423403 RepID=UPI003F1B5C6A
VPASVSAAAPVPALLVPDGGGEGDEGKASGRPDPSGDDAEGTGAGFVAVFAVLLPLLAGTAAVIFLLVGYLLRAVSPDEPVADPMISAGWIFAALAAAGAVAAMAGLLLTALRNDASAVRGPEPAAEEPVPDEVALAKEAWRGALLERGVLPFLREALADPERGTGKAAHESAEPTRNGRPAEPGFTGQTPHLGYSRPGFSSPATDVHGPDAGGARPSYTRPDYTSPEFGSPDRHPD